MATVWDVLIFPTGAVRSVKGALPIALRAKADDKIGLLVPKDNAAEAAVVKGLQVIPIQKLREGVSFLESEVKIAPTRVDITSIFEHAREDELDFADVKGQESVKRAHCVDNQVELDMQPNGCVMLREMDAVFKALADESRRKLLDQLHNNNGQALGELCEHLDMTRQAVTKHLLLLEAANLVAVVWRGREKLHYLNPVPIHEISARWIGKYERHRLQALSDLKKGLEQNKNKKG